MDENEFIDVFDLVEDLATAIDNGETKDVLRQKVSNPKNSLLANAPGEQ
jgi:hypothetical protein